MALTTANFTRPAGRLNPAWYEDDLNALLTALITQAEGLTSDEAAQTAWVYARAYGVLADDAMARPATMAADDIRKSFSDAQLTSWRRIAQDHMDEFNSLTGGAVGGPVLQPIGYDS